MSFTTSLLAIHYARKTYNLQRRGVIDDSKRSIKFFWSREEMIDSLLGQYEDARQGEDIWAQTVGIAATKGDWRRSTFTSL
ncbi:hypothetical protein [Actinomadura macra]|uniref:hypothetical protein n=1 Tax=Actinomadura macra TaxID=46164 RepID=UPI0012F7CA08|nr:hypothetical protein [Actinomadura macra]